MTYSSLEVDGFPDLVTKLIDMHSRYVDPTKHIKVNWYFCQERHHIYPCRTILLINEYVEISANESGCICGKEECDDLKNQETNKF